MKELVKKLLGHLGYEVRRKLPTPLPHDFTPEDRALISEVLPLAMQTPERLHALLDAVRYVLRAGIPGDFVECGVYRGASMMATARVCKAAGETARELWLYDTFEGMPEPQARDVTDNGGSAIEKFARLKEGGGSDWCRAPLDEVKRNVERTGYPLERIHYVKGLVENTIPGIIPERIALLRLDTDFYSSTKHELEHLYPRLAPGGILIVDDYGRWLGARQATDEYLAQHGLRLHLQRLDVTARLAVKP